MLAVFLDRSQLFSTKVGFLTKLRPCRFSKSSQPVCSGTIQSLPPDAGILGKPPCPSGCYVDAEDLNCGPPARTASTSSAAPSPQSLLIFSVPDFTV